MGRTAKLLINKRSGNPALFTKGALTIVDEAIVPTVELHKPDGIVNVLTSEFDIQKWEEVNWPTLAEAWRQRINQIPLVSKEAYYLITGLLLPIWNDLGQEAVRVRRISLDGKTYLGRIVTPDTMNRLVSTFNPDIGFDLSGEQIADAVLNNNSSFNSNSDIRIRRSLVAGKHRIEIVTTDRDHQQACIDRGCYSEIIQYSRRIFVPEGPAADILDKIIKYAPLAPSASKAA